MALGSLRGLGRGEAGGRRARSGAGARSAGSDGGLGPGAKPKRKLKFADVAREAKGLMREHRRSLTIGLVLMIIGRLAGLVLPGSTKYVVDDVLQKGQTRLLLPIALLALGATVVQASMSFALSQVVSVAGQRAIADMRRRVQAHVLKLPAAYFDGTKSGVLIARIMTDAEGIRNIVGTGILQLVGGVFTALIALGWLFHLNWQLTSITLVLLLTFAGSMTFAFRYLRPIFRERGQLTAEVTGRLAETLGGVRTVKVYTAEKREERVFTGGVHRLLRNIARTITGTSALSAVSSVIVGSVGVLIMLVGGRAVQAGTMTIGDLVQYTLFVGVMVAPLVQIAGIGTQISEAFAGLDRIRELMHEPTESEQATDGVALGELDGDVAFEDVSFEYRPGVPVLRDVSFRSPAGTTTALVGPSGSGKSTLISLVMAFNQPLEGKVLVDGHDLREVRLRDYRAQLGAVLQDNFLFDGTIHDNIAFSRPGAPEPEVREAARIAHADEFIEDFEDGYDTIVGERGVKLSGGQRQRVAIARAILADPRILILDEATSSLDSESEAMIRDGLASLRRGRTTFVIAHRLSTIQSADQILVLDEGRIVERGTHAELRRAGGLYQRLYETQYRLELDTFINPGEDFSPQPEAAPLPRIAAGDPRSL